MGCGQSGVMTSGGVAGRREDLHKLVALGGASQAVRRKKRKKEAGPRKTLPVGEKGRPGHRRRRPSLVDGGA